MRSMHLFQQTYCCLIFCFQKRKKKHRSELQILKCSVFFFVPLFEMKSILIQLSFHTFEHSTADVRHLLGFCLLFLQIQILCNCISVQYKRAAVKLRNQMHITLSLAHYFCGFISKRPLVVKTCFCLLLLIFLFV